MLKKLKYQLRKIQAEYYANKLIEPFDKSLFENKRVVIVGGADSVLKEKNGKQIDEYDVVVRVNKGVEVIDTQKDYVGTKTDVLFHAFFDNANDPGKSPITVDLWKKHHVKKIIYSNNHKVSTDGMYNFLNFVRKTNAKLKCTEVTEDLYYKNIEAIKPYWPTTGFIAINTVFNCNPKELFITGVTFFKTPHNKEYRKENIDVFQKMFKEEAGSHNPNAEYEYFKKIYNENKSWIKTDQTLEKILETN